MKDTCYLVLDEWGIQRMTKRQGALKRGEVAVRVAVSIADKCFAEPAISANIVIPESAVIHPVVEITVQDAPEQL